MLQILLFRYLLFEKIPCIQIYNPLQTELYYIFLMWKFNSRFQCESEFICQQGKKTFPEKFNTKIL